MEESFIELIEAPDIQLNITDYNPELEILNDRSDKSSSGVWKHFATIKYLDAIDRKHVYCTHCFANRRIKKYQRSTSTGNLSKHLRKQHNISLNQAFRVKKDADNLIHLIKTEADDDTDKGWWSLCFCCVLFDFKIFIKSFSIFLDGGSCFDSTDGGDEYLVHGKSDLKKNRS